MKGRKESGKAKAEEGGGRSKSCMELNGIELDFRSIMKEVQHLGSSDMTWKERKDLQNKKVVSLGGKAPKQQRLPLSVARPMMKNKKAREEKMLREAVLLGHCGENMVVKTTKQPVEKRRPECGVLKSSEGRFKNGILDVKHLLKPAPTPRDDNQGPPMASKGGKKKTKKKKGGKKNNGKRKGGGGGRKRH